MNTHAHPDPRLAEKLDSLVLAPAPAALRPARGSRRRAMAALSAVLLSAAGVTAVLVPHGLDLLDSPGAPDAGLAGAAPAVAPASSPPPAASGPAADVAAAPAISSAAPSLVAGSGYVVALEEAAVHPRRGGTIVALSADVGDRVEAGQVLLRLDDPDLAFARRAADLARDHARLVLAGRLLEKDAAADASRRMASLSARGAVKAQQAIDAEIAAQRAANLADQGSRELAAAELALEQASHALADLTITAPIGGIVTTRGARLGEAVLAQIDARGDPPLFTITNPERLGIDVDIAETALAALRPGLRGEAVLDSYPDQPFAVVVARVAPVASAERGTVSLRLSPVSPPAGIRPAMAARVSLRADAVVVSNRKGQ